MRLRDEEVLLESCCFLLNYHQEQIKRRGKRTWLREIFLKRIEQGVYHNLLQEMRVNGRESYLAKVMKKNVRPFKVWLCPLLFIKILLKTAQLLSKHFLSGFFLFVSFISFFIKAKMLQQFLSRTFSILFSPFSFVFVNTLITST